MKARKTAVGILVALLITAAVILTARAAMNYTEGRRLESALASLKAEGRPLSGRDLAAACPDADNGAPLLRAAEEIFLIGKGKENALLAEAYRSLRDGTAMDVGTAGAVAALAAGNRKAFDLMFEAAAKPCFHYAKPSDRLSEWALPNLSKSIQAFKLLAAGSVVAAGKSGIEEPVGDLRHGLAFASKLAGDGTLISYLVAMADARMCLLSLDRILSGREAGESLLLNIIGDLGDGRLASWKENFARSYRGERIFFLELGSPFKAATVQRAFGERGLWDRAWFWLVLPLIKRDAVNYIGRFDELEREARRPYFQTRDYWKTYGESIERLPWYSYLSKTFLSNAEAAHLKTASFEAFALAARTGLACRVFKLRTGHYPDRLEELVPALLGAVPTDPFTGKPLVYRRAGDGFMVYSLGSNRKDDGGRMTWEMTKLVMDADDDWSWAETK